MLLPFLINSLKQEKKKKGKKNDMLKNLNGGCVLKDTREALKVLPGYQGNACFATAAAVIVFAITFSAVS